MNLIHTGDWHLKIPEQNESWYITRFKNFINILAQEEADYLAITGDLFDKSPTILEVCLLIWALTVLSNDAQLLIIPGNHDIGKKSLKAVRHHYLNALFNSINFDNIIYTDSILEYEQFLLVSNQYIRAKNKIPNKGKILLSHIRHELTFGDKTRKAEYNLKSLDYFDLCLLSDIHTTFQYSDKIFYSTSPYRTTIKKIQKVAEIDNSFFGYNLVDLDSLEVIHKELYLPNHYKMIIDKETTLKKTDDLIEFVFEMDLDQLMQSNQTNVKIKRSYNQIQIKENLLDMIQEILMNDYGIKDPKFYIEHLVRLIGDI